jgi:tetrathionate reductase subunit B
VENNVPMNHTRIWVHDQGVRGDWPVLSRTFIPYNCMHCDNPPCTEVCVSGATYKDAASGLVLVDQDACIGCGYCVEACPYGVRYIDQKRGVVDKCNACVQRLEVGLEPACVATCVGKARLFGDLNDPNSDVKVSPKQRKTITRLDYEKNGTDTGRVFIISACRRPKPSCLLIHLDRLPTCFATRPHYIAQEGWLR